LLDRHLTGPCYPLTCPMVPLSPLGTMPTPTASPGAKAFRTARDISPTIVVLG
jgi:hypothetical protein